MTGIGLISRRYAKALAEYSAGLGEEAVVYGQLLPLTQRYDYVPAVREAVLSPLVPQEDKLAVISALSMEARAVVCRTLSDWYCVTAGRLISILSCIRMWSFTVSVITSRRPCWLRQYPLVTV